MDKIQFIKVIIFATDDHRFDGQDPHSHGRQAEVFLPLDSISHLEQREKGNPNSGYTAYLKKGHPLNPPFPVKSINTVYLTNEQVEVINAHKG